MLGLSVRALLQTVGSMEEKRKFGGRTKGTWDAKWHLGKTKLVRIPLAISDEVLEIARAIDEGKVEAKDILELVK